MKLLANQPKTIMLWAKNCENLLFLFVQKPTEGVAMCRNNYMKKTSPRGTYKHGYLQIDIGDYMQIHK